MIMEIKILKLSRGKTGHIKNKKLEMVHFSTAKREGLSGRGAERGWLAHRGAIFLPRTIRKAGESAF